MKNNFLKKLFGVLVLTIICVFGTAIGTAPVSAQTPCASEDKTCYNLLVPLPTSPTQASTSVSTTDLASYINMLVAIVISLTMVIAVLTIIYAGFETIMAGDNVSKREEGKKRIMDVFWGFLLLVGAFLLLQFINPNLTHLNNFLTDASVVPCSTAGSYELAYSDSSSNQIDECFSTQDACQAAQNSLDQTSAEIGISCTQVSQNNSSNSGNGNFTSGGAQSQTTGGGGGGSW